jgi:hypothetical protein
MGRTGLLVVTFGLSRGSLIAFSGVGSLTRRLALDLVGPARELSSKRIPRDYEVVLPVGGAISLARPRQVLLGSVIPGGERDIARNGCA